MASTPYQIRIMTMYQAVQKSLVGDTDRHTQTGDLTSLLSFLERINMHYWGTSWDDEQAWSTFTILQVITETANSEFRRMLAGLQSSLAKRVSNVTDRNSAFLCNLENEKPITDTLQPIRSFPRTKTWEKREKRVERLAVNRRYIIWQNIFRFLTCSKNTNGKCHVKSNEEFYVSYCRSLPHFSLPFIQSYFLRLYKYSKK
jgi:hypothetical protein